jgi:hypothetical protein
MNRFTTWWMWDLILSWPSWCIFGLLQLSVETGNILAGVGQLISISRKETL